ncbi:hypothetical protein OROGR_028927 [Orobanche gracilis]
MDDGFEAMKMKYGDLPEFTLLEILKMEKLFKKTNNNPIDQEFCERLSAEFNCSPNRPEKPPVKWEQVQGWFQNKQTDLAAKVVPSSYDKGTVCSKAPLAEKRTKARTISASEAAKVLPDLLFEAQSAKDGAWFDVASFLTYRVLYSGELLYVCRCFYGAPMVLLMEYHYTRVGNLTVVVGPTITVRLVTRMQWRSIEFLVVRARFSGFGKEEDEWVSVKRAIRERSIPLENSECHKVDIGDLMLCYSLKFVRAFYDIIFISDVDFQDSEDNALYFDAHVVEIERRPHDSDKCTCIFVVRYDYDNFEDKVPLGKLCCRPIKSVTRETEDHHPVLLESLGPHEILV